MNGYKQLNGKMVNRYAVVVALIEVVIKYLSLRFFSCRSQTRVIDLIDNKCNSVYTCTFLTRVVTVPAFFSFRK